MMCFFLNHYFSYPGREIRTGRTPIWITDRIGAKMGNKPYAARN